MAIAGTLGDLKQSSEVQAENKHPTARDEPVGGFKQLARHERRINTCCFTSVRAAAKQRASYGTIEGTVTTVGCKSFGRNIRLGFKQQQQDLIYNHLCLRK